MTTDKFLIDAGSNLYFGYGSNLWLAQMQRRCPTSKFIGVARLRDYRWIIMERGYANIVPQEGSEVYGLVYELKPTDLKRLDGQEGFPRCYDRKPIEVEFWGSDGNRHADVKKAPTKEKALIYMDYNNTEDDDPRAEYVHRLNKGIRDALEVGVPKQYVDAALRPFVPDIPDDGLDTRKAEAFEIVHQHFAESLPKVDERVLQNIAERLEEQEDRNLNMRRQSASEIVNEHFKDTLPKIDAQVVEDIARRVSEMENRDMDIRKEEARDIVHQHFSEQLPKTEAYIVENIALRVKEQEARGKALLVENER